MNLIGIKGIGTYVPSIEVNNTELLKRFPDMDIAFLDNKIGISKRFYSEHNELTSDLAVKAVLNLFDENPDCVADKIELLILVTQSPDFQLPNTSGIVQHKLKMPNIASFDVNLGCSGFVYALAIAKSMMHTLNLKNALVVTADRYSKIMDPQDKNTISIFGDASTAVWLEKDATNDLLEFELGTDGSGFESLILPNNLPEQSIESDVYLSMKGREIFNFMMKRIPVSVRGCLSNNRINIEEIDYFLFHQASLFLLKSLGEVLHIPESKLFMYFRHLGNTVSSTIPIALKELIKSKDLTNKNVLLSGFGVGLSWATCIIRFH